MKTYDVIVVGAGHNGLTNAAFLAKAGLDVLCVEKNDYIGGAAVSRNLYKDWIYSNCSYVCCVAAAGNLTVISGAAQAWVCR
ncbi:MAG: FAD-dependent oxidoreductase [Woeseiaceae bacterium]|nr:FAD-dependent oxidoreductase [Woeseiaceae bacterium]